MVQSPVNVIQDIHSWLGWTFQDESRAFITSERIPLSSRIYQTLRPERSYFSVFRKAPQDPQAWRRELSAEQQSDVAQVLGLGLDRGLHFPVVPSELALSSDDILSKLNDCSWHE